MKCAGCLKEADFETVGVLIRPISFIPGKKSGQPAPEPDFFPNGDEEKFLCFECLAGETSVIDLLGFGEQGYDFDMLSLRQGDNGGTAGEIYPTSDETPNGQEIWPVLLGTS